MSTRKPIRVFYTDDEDGGGLLPEYRIFYPDYFVCITERGYVTESYPPFDGGYAWVVYNHESGLWVEIPYGETWTKGLDGGECIEAVNATKKDDGDV